MADEIFVVLEGQGLLRYGDRVYEIRPVDCISCPADTVSPIRSSTPRRRTTHTLTNVEGQRFILTSDVAHDVTTAADLLGGQTANGIIADKAYDANALREMIEEADIELVISSKRNGIVQISHNAQTYKLTNRIQRFFNKLKHFRRIATRYDRRAVYFLVAIQLASSMIWIH